MQLVVGRIGRAHGVLGEVAVEARTDDVEHRFAAGALLQTEPAEVGPLRVAELRAHHGRLLIRFDGVGDRSAAESLRGVLLVADSATSLRPTDPDEYWDHELVGLRVRHVDGTELGLVHSIVHAGGNDLLVVAGPDGSESLIPFVAAIVPEVDLPGGRILVDPPAGLLEL